MFLQSMSFCAGLYGRDVETGFEYACGGVCEIHMKNQFSFIISATVDKTVILNEFFPHITITVVCLFYGRYLTDQPYIDGGRVGVFGKVRSVAPESSKRLFTHTFKYFHQSGSIKSFQRCVTFFLLLNTDEDILKKAHF